MSDIAFTQIDTPRSIIVGPGVNGHAAFTTNTGCRIIRTLDSGCHGEKLIHCSISHRDRYPTWDEIKAMKEYFFGDEHDAIMVFPRKELWVNVHANCFHLWELPKIPGPTGRWEYV